MRAFQTIKPFMIWSCMALMFYFSCQPTSTEPQNDIDHEPIITINKPPVISSITASPDPVQLGKTTTITCNASDPNDDSLSYTWGVAYVTFDQNDSSQVFNWDVDAGSLINSGEIATWTAPLAEGLYVILCKITDIAGNNDVALHEIKVVSTGCLYVMTDKIIYSYGDTVICKLKNETDSTAYFSNCFMDLNYIIDRNFNNKWEVYTLMTKCRSYGGTSELLPGELVMMTISTMEIPLPAGIYRINIPFSWDNNWSGDYWEDIWSGHYSPPDSLLSNTFYVQ